MMKKDYQTHVFTATYTADVSGVCSAMYELGGMTVLHDPSGCNSTYSTHDEPRWFDSDSLMFVSGLDEITAVMGDDSVLIRDVVRAAEDLHPRFITLCGASIPHIIAFDYRGVAHMIEQECGIPVLPVATDGLRSYISGIDLAMTAWIRRFADPSEHDSAPGNSVNLIGVTPLDFSVNGNVQSLRRVMEEAGFQVNCCMAMGNTFEDLTRIYRADVNVVVSSAGRKTARFMKRQANIPFVEGLPIGKAQTEHLAARIRSVMHGCSDDAAQSPSEGREGSFDDADPVAAKEQILVIGEEIFAKSLAAAIDRLPVEKRAGRTAAALWPDVDEGLAEDVLIRAVRTSHTVIADPLYRVICREHAPEQFVPFPHEAYSGRIWRRQIPVFCTAQFDAGSLIR